jgi:hypothetical protein
MLVSVHMPKTAGLSFRATLEEHFGKQFAHDYVDSPLAYPPAERHQMALEASISSLGSNALAGVKCIHGHFLPVKYLPLTQQRHCQFVTWLREPVARLISHYHYWHRSYGIPSAYTSELHRRVVEESWTLEEFCLSPELRNIYTEFLWRFPFQRLDFIGVTEFFDDDFHWFCKLFLGVELEPRRINVGSETCVEEHLSAAAIAKVSQYHAADVALYRRALRQRKKRRQ